ncbi:unnamed protein product [Urochloa humidicola]
MPATTASAASAPPWADLPPELLGDISGRLHVTSDNVRFHAVCWAWRVAACRRPAQLPAAVARRAFRRRRGRGPAVPLHLLQGHLPRPRHLRPGPESRVCQWRGGVAGQRQGGDVPRQPIDRRQAHHFPQGVSDKWLDYHRRSIAGDGTVLLYDFDPNPPDEYYSRDLGRMMPFPPSRFRASLLRPGGGKWRRVWSELGSSDRCCAVAYHRGDVVCVDDLANCHVLWPGWEPICQGKYRLERTWKVQVALPEEPDKVRWGSYLVEFDGGLLLASVLQEAGADSDGLSVSLHELRQFDADKDAGEEPEVEWVRRDQSDFDIAKLRDHVMFLGFPGSFAKEASEFGGEVSGGDAYFVIEDASSAAKPCSVYRYSFRDGVAALVERLPPGWSDARCMWLLPEPQIVAPLEPTEEVGETPVESSGDMQGCGNSGGPSTGGTEDLCWSAGGLSPKVDNSRLREMFSVYGKVARAKVAYDKKGRSRGFGFVTMATQEGFDMAMAALVNVVEEEEPQPHPHGGFTGPFSLLVTLLILCTIFMFFYSTY